MVVAIMEHTKWMPLIAGETKITHSEIQRDRPYTIDAYAKINHADIEEVKRALYVSASKCIAVCFGLPLAWAWQDDFVWDIPKDQKGTGDFQVGSWGYHSMTAIAKWDEKWLYLPSTWDAPMGKISWEAFAMYASEAYMVVDSVNDWKKKVDKKTLNIPAMVSDINSVSDIKIV